MRAFLILLLFAAAVQAAPRVESVEVGFSWHALTFGAPTISPTMQFWSALPETCCAPNYPVDELITTAEIAGVTPSSLWQHFVINETNASSYGMDWLPVQAGIDTYTAGESGPVTVGNRNPLEPRSDWRLVGFDLERINYDVLWYTDQYTPPTAGYQYNWRWIGTGLVVPEPSALAMLLAASAAFALWRR